MGPRGGRQRRAVLLPLLLLCGCAPRGEAKHASGAFHLSAGDLTHGPEHEIAKFSFTTGKALIRGTVRYSAKDINWHTSPALYLFSDDKWDAYHSSPACMDKVEHAHTVIQIGQGGAGHRSGINYGYGHLAKNTKTRIEREGDQQVWHFDWEVDHSERTTGWFLIAADCALEQYNTRVAPMTYEVSMFNPGMDHLPADEHWLPTAYTVVLAGMVAYGLYCVYRVQQMSQHTKIHLVVKLLGVAYLLQIVATAGELLHQWLYSLNGRGLFLLDYLSEVSEGLSALVISFVLICMACGWTLVDDEADAKRTNSVATILRNPRLMLKGGNIIGNILALLIFALVVWTMFLIFTNKLFDEDFKKFHDNDSAPGRMLLHIRAVLFVLFAISLGATVNKQRQRGGSGQLRSFLLRLLVLGSLWFIAFPLMVMVANAAPHYHRHRIVAGGVLFLQSSCLSLLAYQFLSEGSAYARLSTAWESGLLPGAGGLLAGEKMRD
eukprot:TRINITY_DN23225_c0_g1_i1.p1 TRINITY_DN23225_c0_g1~~TRINITY_DN23225_c0_g1_i1.p1  ORF type:complete len:533 (+),score=198.86 TRINITY_DN23225_c0_g1_i1:126-1601(+)